jgi:hypothetical protein
MVGWGSMTTGLRWARVGAALAVACAAACSDRGEGGGPSDGALGFASFRWLCAGSGDVACVPARVEGFSRKVAVGATFEAGFVFRASVPNELSEGWLVPVGPTVQRQGSYGGGYGGGYGYDGSEPEVSASFRALAEGTVTLLAMADDETVADYTVLSLQPVSSLTVVHDCRTRACGSGVDGAAPGLVSAGERIDLRAEPYGGGTLLVGHLDYTWESLSPDVAELDSSRGHVATLRAIRAGTASVRVQGGGAEVTVAIVIVSDGPRRPRPGGSADTETDTGTGTETDTGTQSGTDTGPSTDGEAGTGTDTGTTGGTR